MKKYLIVIALLFFATPVYAANTSGYAWSESLGWFDFSNVTVDDSNLSGYAYNDNTGWLVLDGVSNSEGDLSGYAWSESVGYFDFNSVSISDNSFSGYAYNDNTGFLDMSSVDTDWKYRRITSSGSSSRKRSTAPAPVVKEEVVAPKNSLNIGEIIQILIEMDILTPEQIEKVELLLSDTEFNFSVDLELNDVNESVRDLQVFLNNNGYQIAASGPGALGNETNFFGSLTQAALIRFQKDNGISPSIGYFGPITREFIKNNY